MNQYQALVELLSLPEVTRISVARVKPTDVLVMECDAYLSIEEVGRIEKYCEDAWPGQKVVVLQRGMKLKVVEGL